MKTKKAILSGKWEPDILGPGFEMMHVRQLDDYSGEVVSTIIRALPPGGASRAVLYIHGFSDYFFQWEMALECVAHGYAFYAVDLRKYGRSHLPEQRFFEVRSLREYFPDIDAALEEIRSQPCSRIAIIGHSTGGLIAAMYMAKRKPDGVEALVLNSPFLAWNLPRYQRVAVPLIAFLGKYFPKLPITQPDDTRYARTLHKEFEGEWEYDRAWKPDRMPDVDAGWVRAIERAQKRVRKGADIKVPVLVLTSAESARGKDPMEKFHRADGILNAAKIRRQALTLGDNVTVVEIHDGLHDLALSALPVRRVFYDNVFLFLDSLL